MNYELKVIQNSFEIITKDGFKWGDEFTHNMRLKLVKLMLDYFTNVEEYEKCSVLLKIYNDLENLDESYSETDIKECKDS